jgi:hypothetical protein
MTKRAEELRSMAEECRTLAAAAKSPEIREQILQVAEQFERQADFQSSDDHCAADGTSTPSG